MKFTILEEQMSREAFDAFVRDRCSQFIRESAGLQLFRGMKTRKNYGDFAPDFLLATPRTDRTPKDMPDDLHEALDEEFYNKFGWRARSAGVFCTGKKANTYQYGEPYVIYPVDGYSYIWSPKVADLYESGDEEPSQNNDNDNWLNHFKEKLLPTYKDTDLVAAIKSENEIVIKCDQYICRRADIPYEI